MAGLIRRRHSAYTESASAGRSMPTTATAREVNQCPPAVSTKEAEAAFDYTCRYYLKISGAEFLEQYDGGLVRRNEANTALMRVFAMLPFVR
jgi:hypothetical protein